MNEALRGITELMRGAFRDALPDVSMNELEEQGAVYYMNGRNGTAFDWFVNERLPSFMMFYDDAAKLGAVKANVFRDGGVEAYVYGDRGSRLLREITDLHLDVREEELLRLAALLWHREDEQGAFDANVEGFSTDREPEPERIAEFQSLEEYLAPSIRRRRMLDLRALVSNKVAKEGWRVGFMCREEPDREGDSGWSFYAGNEEDEYLSDWQNYTMMPLGAVWRLDSAVWNCMDSPAGTELIRVSDTRFEPDDRTKPVEAKKR